MDLIGPPAVPRRILQIRVCLSFRPSFHLSGRFLVIISLAFSKFWHGTRNPYEVVRERAGFSGKKIIVPKIEKGPKMGQKQDFLNLLKNLVINFYWICSVMKTYVIAVFLHKSHIWENFCFWDVG